MNAREEQVRVLVDRWEDALAEGRDLSVAELCHECPELMAAVQSRIDRLKATAWLEGPPASSSNVYEAARRKPPRNDESRNSASLCPVAEFAKRLATARVLTSEQAQSLAPTLAKQTNSADARPLAEALVKRRWLTAYQSHTLLHGGEQLCYGEYLVLEPLGSGGMGQVFKARHRRMERVVALKVMSPAALQSSAAAARFHREVKAAARLVHPNIVTAFDAGEDHGVHFLVMEFINGRDFSQVLAERGPLPLQELLGYMLQAARGLEYAHLQGVVHRDIKPANLLLDGNGTVKILDMGLARIDQAEASGERQLTQSGQVMGTVEYMAPEQALDIRHADPRSDIYALGCTLFRLLTGQVLYSGDTPIKIVLAHMNEAIPSLAALRSDLPAGFEGVFQKLVAKEPADRYANMAAVITALEAFKNPSTAAGGATVQLALAVRPEPPSQQGAKTTRSRWLIPGAAGGVLALIVVLGVAYGWLSWGEGLRTESKPTDFKPTVAEAKSESVAESPVEPGTAPATSAKPVAVTAPPAKPASEPTTKPAATNTKPSTETVYLDDIPEKAMNVIRHLGKHGLDNDDHAYTWHGQRPAHALYAHPHPESNSWVTYDLSEKHFGGFHVTAAISEDINDHVSSALTFKVYGDGQLLRQSAPLQHVGDARDMFVRIRGVKELKLEVVCPGYNGQAHALWLNPRLTLSSEKEETP